MTEYLLVLRMTVPGGEKVLGKFFLGESAETALEVYRQLQGTENIEPHHILFFDFIKSCNGLPLDLKLIGCSLEEASANVKIIVKNLFTAAI